MNKFGDLTAEEFKAQYLGRKQPLRDRKSKASTYLGLSNVNQLPDSIDWRTQGYVTEVKDQGQCGSCWAFSATGSLEGQYFKKEKKLINFSEQQLVDCSGDQGNMGCNGGLMDYAFEYLKTNGAENQTAYPYTAQDGTCMYKPAEGVVNTTGFIDVTSGSEGDLQQAVGTIGPVSVAIDASQNSFQFYKGGVYDEPACSSSQLDHGVLAVGYSADSGKDYWIVKNSWGTSWGMQGYIWMSRNKQNQCGIATASSYPLV
jgi:cathepsin L